MAVTLPDLLLTRVDQAAGPAAAPACCIPGAHARARRKPPFIFLLKGSN